MIEKTGFGYYWNLFLIYLRNIMKITTEYKLNLFGHIIIQIIFTLFPLLFGYVIIDNFGEVINWNFLDYLIFFFYTDFSVTLMGSFCWSKSLFKSLQSGELNTYLVRPSNQYLGYYLDMKFNGIIFGLINSIILIPFILYFSNFNFFSILLSFIIAIFIGISFALVRHIGEAISFFNYGLSYFYEEGILRNVYNALRVYPGLFFEQSKIKYFVLLIPIYFVSILINPLFYGNYIFGYFYWFNLSLLIFIFLISIILLRILWKKGLKKYEGFN